MFCSCLKLSLAHSLVIRTTFSCTVYQCLVITAYQCLVLQPINPISLFSDEGILEPCPSGYRRVTSQADCQRWSNDDGDNSTICYAGYVYNGTSCIMCPKDSYSFAGDSECSDCPGNSSSLAGSTSPSNCTWENDDEGENKNSTACDAGYYFNSLYCEMCPQNTYKREGSLNCTDCPDKHVSPMGSTSWRNCTEEDENSTACDAGYYFNGRYCEMCPRNTYKRVGSMNCTSCPDSHVSLMGSTSWRNCTKEKENSTACDAGYYFNGRYCEMCPRNTYSNERSVYCTECPRYARSERGSNDVSACRQGETRCYYQSQYCYGLLVLFPIWGNGGNGGRL